MTFRRGASTIVAHMLAVPGSTWRRSQLTTADCDASRGSVDWIGSTRQVSGQRVARLSRGAGVVGGRNCLAAVAEPVDGRDTSVDGCPEEAA